MVGWYRPNEDVRKNSMTILRSYMGVVLYERNYYAKFPFVLCKKGKPIAEISDKAFAEKEFNKQFADKRVFISLPTVA